MISFKDIKRLIKKFIHTISSTYLCIRYPFLYPRNRWNGRHYTNHALEELLTALRKVEQDTVWFEITTESELNDSNKQIPGNVQSVNYFTCISGKQYRIIKQKKNSQQLLWTISDYNNTYYTFDSQILLSSGEIKNVYYNNVLKRIIVVTSDDAEETNNDIVHTIELYKNTHISFIVKCVNIYYDVLSLFHCIPTYNEWDAVEPGWNKAFGKQYLKDLKNQLKKDNMLHTWRITQIKEKFGEFRLYCNYGSDELYDIISKYEDLSRRTCIRCGKSATKMSTGWISPYCDDCAPEGSENI